MADMKKDGPWAIVRDTDGRVAHRQLDQGGPRKNWKHFARLLTNNGMDMMEKMVRIARGESFQTTVTMPDGSTMLSEPLVPPMAVQHAAAKDVFELIHGKAVAATELVRAESEAEEMERIRSMTDAELMHLLERGTEDAVLVEGSPAEEALEVLPYDPTEGE